MEPSNDYRNTAQKVYTSFESGQVHNVLSSLGYAPIQDFGKYYRTKAIYRGGEGTNSLKVWKNSGWCVDFGGEEKGFPLSSLVQRTLGTKDPSVIKRYLGTQKNVVLAERPKLKISMPRIYPEESLNRLIPNYSFYKKRGISESTLVKHKVGLATTGKMYQRLVFPIYDDVGQIVGFSGRKINENNDAPKWKHIGLKNTWVYPYNLPTFQECREAIESTRKIFLVESIGDSMSLSESRVYNNLVGFGLGCSAALQAFFLQEDPEEIIIATNNDDTKKKNNGRIAAIKTLIKMSGFFPVERLKIKVPLENDISDMLQSGHNIKDWVENGEFLPPAEIRDFIAKHPQEFDREKTAKFLKKI